MSYLPVSDSEYARILSIVLEDAEATQLQTDAQFAQSLHSNQLEEEEHKSAALIQAEEEIRALLESEEREERERETRMEEEAIRFQERMREEELKELDTGVLECEVCFGGGYYIHQVAQCSEAHLICIECARTAAEVTSEQHSAVLDCLATAECDAQYEPAEYRKFLSERQLKRLEKVRLDKDLKEAGIENLVSCSHCNYSVINDIDTEEKVLFCQNPDCPNPNSYTCILCGKADHRPDLCEGQESKAIHQVAEAMSSSFIRLCPGTGCQKPFLKTDGCNHIQCPSCKTESCYLCRAKISGYSHFRQSNTPCQGKLFDSKTVSAEVEAARIEARKKLQSEDDIEKADKLKLK